MVVVGDCWGRVTLGGGCALGSRRDNMGGGRGDAATATVTLVVRCGDRRGGGRWYVSVGAAPRGSDGGVSTGDGVVPGYCWLLCVA